MKKTMLKLLAPVIFTFTVLNALMAQNESIYTAYVIEEQNYERDNDTVGFALNRYQSLPNYFRSSFLYVHDELQEQLDALIVNAPFPLKPLSGAENWHILEEHIAVEARIAAKLTEINLVSEASKIPGKVFLRPHQLFSDWHLRSKYHELAKAYAINQKFSGENWSTFKPVYEKALADLEAELQVRGFFPKITKRNAAIGQLLDTRFRLVEEFNIIARQEAMNFVDASPVLIENRARMAEIALEVDQIDEKLNIENDKRPNYRNLLTEETVLFRLETLEHGKRSAEVKHHVMRHADSEVHLLIAKIDEQLAEEKKWFYMEKNHQVIGKGYSNRGPPPNDSPTLGFEETPFPKRPSPGDGTLGDFINEAKSASIDKNKQKTFERTVSQWVERFKALNLNSPRWADYQFHAKPARSFDFNTLESFLKNHAKCYFERLPVSAVEAVKHKAVFETIANEAFGIENAPKMTDFIVEKPTELIQYKYSLEKRIAIYGPHATTGEQLELKEIEKHITEILNRDKIPVKLEVEMGINRNRPPPGFEELVLKIYDAEIKGLQALAARHGSIDAPPSIVTRLKEIEKIISTNKVATALNGYRQFAEESSRYEILKYIDPESELLKDFEVGRQAWATEFDNIFKKASYAGSVELPTVFYEKAKNAQSTLAAGKKTAQTKLINRPPQDYEKYEAMTRRKTPGGIWLSPKGFNIPPKEDIGFTWLQAEDYEECPYENEEWPFDSFYSKRICFPVNHSPSNAQHWLNKIQPW